MEKGTKQTNDYASLIGKDLTEAIGVFGKTYDKGPSRFHYEWLVFKDDKKYISVGHIDSKIVTIVFAGENVFEGKVKIGDSYDAVAEKISIPHSLVISNETGEYRFELSDDERKQRPLVKLADDVYAQLYFDTFSETLVAVRLLDEETLLKHRPYRLVYRGDLKKYTVSSRLFQKDIERMNEKQIFDVTNVIRKQYRKPQLAWSSDLANVAYQHSKDMKENRYFDHISPIYGDLEKRLKTGSINYSLAGENIAAGYPDGIDAVIGWLNSDTHREALLHDEFTHLGVGVYDVYYTQNFIKK